MTPEQIAYGTKIAEAALCFCAIARRGDPEPARDGPTVKVPAAVTIDEQIRHVERELEWQLRRAPARRESPAGRYVDRDLERWRAVLATLKAVRARGVSGA